MIGIDEVGRGAWAGPLLVAAVRLHQDIPGLTDSKLLSAKKRSQLCISIQMHADIGFGWMSAQQIDEIGLALAIKQCAAAAAESIFPSSDEQIIVDGSVNLLVNYRNVIFEPRAEQAYPCVAAASIVAKVFRDNYMQQIHHKVPHYAFNSHVGYGTIVHIAALHQHGVSPWHRMSYKPVKALAKVG